MGRVDTVTRMSDLARNGSGGSRTVPSSVPATVSVDVDPVDLHLVGYGLPGGDADTLVYRVAVPRLLEEFSRCGIHATFFFVGRDAPAQAPVIRRVIEAGHEVACHSMTHPASLAKLPPSLLLTEVAESRVRVEQAAGAAVMGFRAPNFDLDRRVADALASAGYDYDASGYPTPMLLLARLVLALKSRDRAGVLGMTSWPMSMERAPHLIRCGDGWLREFPLSVSPHARIPVYHTLRYGMSSRRFSRLLDALAHRKEPLSYLLHAVDVLGMEEDGVHPGLAAHPGMNRALQAKLALLRDTLDTIAARFDVIPFRDRLPAAGE